jgi:hypothetical protein
MIGRDVPLIELDDPDEEMSHRVALRDIVFVVCVDQKTPPTPSLNTPSPTLPLEGEGGVSVFLYKRGGNPPSHLR